MIDGKIVVDDALDQSLVMSIYEKAKALDLEVAASFDDTDIRSAKDERFINKVGNTRPFMGMKIDPDFDQNLSAGPCRSHWDIFVICLTQMFLFLEKQTVPLD